MRLNVPFYVQGINECGPVALKMIFEFFGERHELIEIKDLVDSEKSGITYTTGLARASSALGFKSEVFSARLEPDPSNYELEFYKKNTEGFQSAKEKLDKIKKDCIKQGVKLEQKEIDINEITMKIDDNCVAIVLLDWGKVVGDGIFRGHFLAITGCDDDFIFVHQPGPPEDMPFYPIKRETFDLARKSKGTDQDILFIHRKSS